MKLTVHHSAGVQEIWKRVLALRCDRIYKTEALPVTDDRKSISLYHLARHRPLTVLEFLVSIKSLRQIRLSLLCVFPNSTQLQYEKKCKKFLCSDFSLTEKTTHWSSSSVESAQKIKLIIISDDICQKIIIDSANDSSLGVLQFFRILSLSTIIAKDAR